MTTMTLLTALSTWSASMCGALWVYAGSQWAAAALIGAAVAYYYSTSTHGKWARLNVPHVRPVPLFGNYLSVAMGAEHPVDVYKRVYRELAGHRYGGYYQMRTPYLMVRDPELINRILIKDHAAFPDRGIYVDFTAEPLAENLFFMRSPRWRTMRSRLSPAFTSGRLKLVYEQMEEYGVLMADGLRALVRSGDGVVDVREVLAGYATDVIGTCAFGLRMNAIVGCDSDDDGRRCSEFRRYGRTLFAPSPRTLLRELCLMVSPTLLRLVRLAVFPRDAIEFFRGTFAETMSYRERNAVVRDDFVQMLMRARKELTLEGDRLPKQERFSEIQILAQAFAMFAAGFDTVSTTLSFCLYELSLKTHIQEKLRDEFKLAKAKHNGIVNHELLIELNYMDMVIAETLRKYPLTFGLFREAAQTYQVPNDPLVIEKGQKILIPIHSLHYDYKYFNDPETFDPERFSLEEKTKRPKSVYLPFGDGPRICIGKRFAEIEMKLALMKILSEFAVEPCEKTEIPVKFSNQSILTIPKNETVFLKLIPLSDCE